MSITTSSTDENKKIRTHTKETKSSGWIRVAGVFLGPFSNSKQPVVFRHRLIAFEKTPFASSAHRYIKSGFIALILNFHQASSTNSLIKNRVRFILC